MNTDEYVLQEQLDGYDAIEWLAAQPFCDGHVNQMGISYGGFTSLQVATHAPPHLTSIIPMYFTDDRYTDDCHYRGGHLRKYYDVGHYGNFMIAYNALPPYPEWSGGDWATDLGGAPRPQRAVPARSGFRHQTDGPYWRHGSVRRHRRPDRVPRVHDRRLARRLPEPAAPALPGAQRAEEGAGRSVEPRLPDVAVPGPRIDYLHEVVRWLDHWCKGRATGIMDEPPVVLFDAACGAARRRPARQPRASGGPRRTGRRRARVSGRSTCGDGGLLDDAPAADGEDAYEYDPTVGVTAGLWSGGLQFGLPGDQRPDEALSLVYTAPPARPRTCTSSAGRGAILHVSSTATRDRLRREPVRRRSRTGSPTSSRREC